ncbi:bifunctional demethylmenaquinone methyltransferase/2-methoxy-6-polyprenyl-1,4-benzoquinol methylase UbiE [Candidatus Riesia pediculicola]|uniref:Ubiquinone/menaquinone biosynthesis C-methyltransferase UbiE n=1 Tax=Riesia pediculicola (strain USDA) TaxID=515618 RepID=D4G8W6_RIEPU|nr:bifunctional demethylmenaquinone methyltransferase/2-methoxy-6-polyprenyl-1,4-benzoquinol methylase UbiE [Candidatus Riesia pediculicola]ADD79806.1 ubiquinone/menaquinone biosynthesis methyltransferase UbiE [Candidatus Riesia pediculicola USDA]ARC53977.1 ubiquinone biosynthesis methyltransferase UbiE [Candidatus Riesia pediculicola]ARC54566.1 ubiquinone biosynthesis methyltransferase UbiE [Candidatus Riesia pediculicola]QOJ86604.1 bifunctional demethylmenaquinone methyltransferase/2-methoxy-
MFNRISNQYIKSIFNHSSDHYDLMNDMMSLGTHRIWKNVAVKVCNLKQNHTVLDLAGGTGDLTIKFAKILKNSGKIFLVDINKRMIEIGKRKIRNLGLIKNIYYIQASAENLPFEDFSFDVVVVSFGLRNIQDQEKSLKSIFRVLKTGGKLVILEFSKPSSKTLKKLYSIYSFFLPYLGLLFFDNFHSYQYLIRSIQVHPDQNYLKKMIEKSGFKKVNYLNLIGGIVSIHVGYKTIFN